jgi:hypothetical protein
VQRISDHLLDLTRARLGSGLLAAPYGSLLKASSAWASPRNEEPIARVPPAASVQAMRSVLVWVFQRRSTSSFRSVSAMHPPGRHFRQPRSSGSSTLPSAEKLGELEKVTLTGSIIVRRSGSDFFTRPIASAPTVFCWSCPRICCATSHTRCVSAPLPICWQRRAQSPKLATVLFGSASTAGAGAGLDTGAGSSDF